MNWVQVMLKTDLAELLDHCVIPLFAIRSRRKGYEVSTMKALDGHGGYEWRSSAPAVGKCD
jgi:hypothetical protein